MERASVNLSNLTVYIDDTIAIACNLGIYWSGQDFGLCQKIQKLTFPDGVKWDKENRRLLTDGGNEFFDLLFKLSDSYKYIGLKKEGKSCDLSSMVAGGGLIKLLCNLLFLLLARHSLQAAYALASCVGSNPRFSPSLRAYRNTNGAPFGTPLSF